MKTLRSLGHAAQGVRACYKAEKNFKIHICLSAIAIFLAIVFHISTLQWVAILFCIALVLALEMFNTVIERICNFIHPGVHPAIKIIKDIAAGSVLVASFSSFVIGCIIFLPKIFSLLKSI